MSVTRYKGEYGIGAHAARDLIVRGLSRDEVAEDLIANGFDPDEVDQLVEAGQILLISQAVSDNDLNRAILIARAERVYSDSLSHGHYRESIAALKLLKEVQGIGPPTVLANDPSGRPFAGLKEDELKERIRFLYAEMEKNEEQKALPPSPNQDPESFNSQIDKTVPPSVPVTWYDDEPYLPILSHPLDDAIESAPSLGAEEMEEEERVVMEF